MSIDDLRSELAIELAEAFLAGPWNAERLAESGAGCLDRWPDWMTSLTLRVVAVYRSPPIDYSGPLVELIERFLAEHPESVGQSGPQIVRLLPPARSRRSPQLDHRWPVTPIDSVAALAERLELSDGQLAWLADVRGLERTATVEKLRNYRYLAMPRRSGLPRVIEAPKARLKEVQRWLLHEVLDHVPAHAAAHGFSRGRSAVTHASLHTGCEAVLRLDLQDFFASVPAGRVYAIFRTIGYRPEISHVLTGLSTNTIPATIWAQIAGKPDPRLVPQRFRMGRQLATPHLPQGAPTSPALANLAAFRLDRRLTGLADSLGLRYSRYADDLAFSGPTEYLRRASVRQLVSEIARAEGFTLNRDKSALSTAAGRQSLCGIVVNVRPNVTRAEYDRLKAILHNATRADPERQNRSGVGDYEAHLRGRIAWIAALHPERGERLRRRFAEIRWGEETD